MLAFPARPLYGSYRRVEGGAEVATEEWKLFPSGDNIVVRSRILSQGVLEDLRLTLDRSWGYLALVMIRQEPEGKGATYEGRAWETRWRATVTATEGHQTAAQFPWGPAVELDYRSPLFNGITIRRLGLGVGEGKEIEVVFMQSETFEPCQLRQRYTRREDNHIDIKAGHFPCQVYTYQSLASGYTGTIWSDPLGNVLKFDDWYELTTFGRE